VAWSRPPPGSPGTRLDTWEAPMQARSQIVLRGMLAGLAAGAVVAVWFLVVDLVAGDSFRTPTLLGRTLLGADQEMSPTRLALAYTVVHFGVFAFLGALIAGVLRAFGLAPAALLGLLFGVGVLDGIYYTALLVTGADVLNVLPAIHVLGANLAAGVVLMACLHRLEHSQTAFGLGELRHHDLAMEGLATGLIGAAVVALWILLFDVIRGQPFATPAALGSALFLNADSGDAVRTSVGIVLAYTVVHAAAFSLVGVLLAWSARRLERNPGMWLGWLIGFVILEGFFIGTVGTHAQWVQGAVGWWAVAIGNVLAVVTMGWWVWRHHPRLAQELLHEPVETRV